MGSRMFFGGFDTCREGGLGCSVKLIGLGGRRDFEATTTSLGAAPGLLPGRLHRFQCSFARIMLTMNEQNCPHSYANVSFSGALLSSVWLSALRNRLQSLSALCLVRQQCQSMRHSKCLDMRSAPFDQALRLHQMVGHF